MEPSSHKKRLSFKGRGSAVRVSFDGQTIPGVVDVKAELRDAGPMVTSHPLVVDFRALPVSRNWLSAFLGDVVFPMGLSVAMWAASDPATQDILASLGFKLDGGDRPLFSPSSLKIVSTPLRSGQSLFHEGDVVLLGNLHSGAEINATGSIVVLGSLLGQVHAGCTGDNSASVITMCYKTNQLRIGTMISNAVEPGASPWWGRSVRFHVQGGVFVAREIAREKER